MHTDSRVMNPLNYLTFQILNLFLSLSNEQLTYITLHVLKGWLLEIYIYRLGYLFLKYTTIFTYN